MYISYVYMHKCICIQTQIDMYFCTCACLPHHRIFQPLHCAVIQAKDITHLTYFAANWIFSRVRTRQRREKQAAGHNLLYNLIKMVLSMGLPARINMQVGAQQQLRDHANKFASTLTQQKQKEVRHKVQRECTGACPARSLSARWGLQLQT